ncbi:CPBP family intramembrane glutamic endopeptidase [Methylobacter sp.]|uniref:CPBP family intramembrane glutamic endopeptidase n=1 Tax=Methylobacter sp. TaxID=2051955 RepID=UPI002FDE7398
MIQLNSATLITYGLLTLALLGLWLPRTPYFPRYAPWAVLLVIAIIAGLFFNILQPMALLWIVLLGVSTWALTQKNFGLAINSALFAIVFLLSVGLLTHQLPGFSNPKIISNLHFSDDAIPYDKYLNFDNVLVGLFILGFGHQRLAGVSEWQSTLKRMTFVTPLTLFAVMCLSLLLGYVQWQPKWTPVFFVWAWGNLFFTCIVEEAFFRGFIQKYLMQGLSKVRYGDALAIAITAVLFGLAHYMGGNNYILLATVAGVGYGWVYRHTGRIEASILTHFSLNSLHLLLFTYPALATSMR